MKTIYRSLGFGMMLAAFIAVGALTGYGQAVCDDFDAQNELDTKFRDNYAGTLAQRKIAVEAAKQYIEKFATCEVTADMVAYFKENIPPMEAKIKTDEEAVWLSERFKRFDSGIQGKKYDEAFAAGKEILTKQPDNLNILVPLGAIGLHESYTDNNKYNDESLRFARTAIQKMESGVTSNKYGVFQFEYGTKENALSEMYYAQAYINYHKKNDKKGALPYYYKVAQMPGVHQTNPLVFETVGGYYYEEVVKLADVVKTLIAEQNAAETDELKIAKDAEIKATIGLLNGNAERAIDALSRAHKVTKDDAASKEYKTSLFDRIKTLYTIRFERETGLNEYMASTLAKPMPDPTSEVKPVGVPVDADDAGTDASATAGGNVSVAKP